MNIDEAAVKIHQTAREHGFWDKERNLGEMLMLVASELAECLEEDRESNPAVYFKCTTCGYISDTGDYATHYVPVHGVLLKVLYGLGLQSTRHLCDERRLKPEGSLVELIDAIIRLLDTSQDMASRTRYTVSDVMAMKMDYNDSRGFMHGKAY